MGVGVGVGLEWGVGEHREAVPTLTTNQEGRTPTLRLMEATLMGRWYAETELGRCEGGGLCRVAEVTNVVVGIFMLLASGLGSGLGFDCYL